MGLSRTLKTLRSRWFGTVSIDDPRPVAAASPYTFWLPPAEHLEALRPGDLVKVIVRPHPCDRTFDAERMWFSVQKIEGDDIFATLVNVPTDMPQLKVGAELRLHKAQVVDIDWADGREQPPSVPQKCYWDRCLVDSCIVDGSSLVDFLYREEPDMGAEGEHYPDSGWRIRGSDEKIAEDEASGRAPQYVALGLVLNRDDRWLDLIDAPVGSAFRWSDIEGCFMEICE